MKITPKKILDIYLYDITDYLTELKLSGFYTFDDAMSDLENSSIGDLTVEDYYSKNCYEVRMKFSDARDSIYELIDEIIEYQTLEEIINSNHWFLNSRISCKIKTKFDNVTKIAINLIKYNDSEGLTENHLNLARQKDKQLFETLFLNYE